MDDAGLGFRALVLGACAWRRASSIGYEGKGIFYAFAAGNGHLDGDHSNLDELVNYLRGDGGLRGERGGNKEQLLGDGGEPVGVRTFERPQERLRGRAGLYRGTVTTEHEDRYYDDFGGTSSATPVVSGTAALMRSVNPDLSWRDLKLILAATARKTEPDNPGWETGAQKYMSDSEDRRL